jgi:hypothetical protein
MEFPDHHEKYGNLDGKKHAYSKGTAGGQNLAD